MERYQIILFFAILSFAGWDANSLSIKRIIKRVGIRIKFYPAHYIMPSKKMRKIFKLEKKYPSGCIFRFIYHLFILYCFCFFCYIV